MVAAAPPPLDIHGFVEFDWESTLINPNGQVLGTHGAESMVAGLNWTVYHGGGWINSVTLGGLVVADWIDEFQGAWALNDPQRQRQLLRLGRRGHRVSHVLELLDVERPVHDRHFRKTSVFAPPPTPAPEMALGLCRSTN